MLSPAARPRLTGPYSLFRWKHGENPGTPHFLQGPPSVAFTCWADERLSIKSDTRQRMKRSWGSGRTDEKSHCWRNRISWFTCLDRSQACLWGTHAGSLFLIYVLKSVCPFFSPLRNSNSNGHLSYSVDRSYSELLCLHWQKNMDRTK